MNKTDEYEIQEREAIATGTHALFRKSSPRADELIACLEGEIAKRDETIARLEPQLNLAIQANYDLRSELAAIKAQEPAAIEFRQFMTDVVTGAGLLSCGKQSKGLAAELSANAYKYLLGAPVSEAKAQGVVMPDRLKPSRYELQDARVDAWNACLAEVARLNAAPVQQVSVPGEREAFEREAVERYGYTWASIYSRRQGLGYSDSSLCMAWIMWQARARLAAATVAPAAGALYEALRQITREYIRTCVQLNGDKEEEMQDVTCVKAANKALAAHRAKGVV